MNFPDIDERVTNSDLDWSTFRLLTHFQNTDFELRGFQTSYALFRPFTGFSELWLRVTHFQDHLRVFQTSYGVFEPFTGFWTIDALWWSSDFELRVFQTSDALFIPFTGFSNQLRVFRNIDALWRTLILSYGFFEQLRVFRFLQIMIRVFLLFFT